MYKKIKNICVISDIHCRPYWRNINPDDYDKIIFLGDYCDSFHYSDVEFLHNLKEIIAFKKAYYEKVILLIGNHDQPQYLYKDFLFNSGFRFELEYDLYDLFNKNSDLFQICYVHKNYLFSHAGITNRWLKVYKKDINAAFRAIKEKFKLKAKVYSLFEKINWLQHSEWGRQLIFSYDSIRSQNPSLVGGCIWVDKLNSRYDSLKGYIQFVGHTPVDGFETYGHGDTSITFCDVLGTKQEFKIITIPD